MDVTSLTGGIVAILIGLFGVWIALPGKGVLVSRTWLRSQAGVLYPLVPLVFLVFGIFFVLRGFGLA